jgi:hypothetical protein
MPSRAERDERPHEPVRDSLNGGQDVARAEEITTRTVNKQRRPEGRASNGKTRRAGNPRSRLEKRTCQELRTLASKLKIPGRSQMNKETLVKAIKNARNN